MCVHNLQGQQGAASFKFLVLDSVVGLIQESVSIEETSYREWFLVGQGLLRHAFTPDSLRAERKDTVVENSFSFKQGFIMRVAKPTVSVQSTVSSNAGDVFYEDSLGDSDVCGRQLREQLFETNENPNIDFIFCFSYSPLVQQTSSIHLTTRNSSHHHHGSRDLHEQQQHPQQPQSQVWRCPAIAAVADHFFHGAPSFLAGHHPHHVGFL